MLRYEWNNHSPPPPNLILSDLDLHHHHHHHNHHHHHDFSTTPSSTPTLSNPHRPIFDDPFSNPCNFPLDNTPPPPPHHHHHQQQHHQIPFYGNNNINHDNHNHNNDHNQNSFGTPNPCSSFLTLESLSSVMQIPKNEPDQHFFTNRPIGLNLGRRTYFSADDDLVSRLYRRSRGIEPTINSPKCQAEGCNADLSHAKHYHRRFICYRNLIMGREVAGKDWLITTVDVENPIINVLLLLHQLLCHPKMLKLLHRNKF
ncbi:Squamosa promoter-binding-like protein 8 [Bienertia sinuspersici]